MFEIPIGAAVLLALMFFALGAMAAQVVGDVTRDGRKRRALAKAIPTWEVHVGSDGRDLGYGIISTGDSVVVCVRKVRRIGQHFELLQKIEVARVRGDADPDKILTAVDRAQAMVSTLSLTGAS